MNRRQVAFLVVLALLALGGSLWVSASLRQMPAADAVNTRQLLRSIPIDGDRAGMRVAPIRVDVWTDPGCADCQELLSQTMPQVLTVWAEPGEASFHLRPWGADGADAQMARLLIAAGDDTWALALLSAGRTAQSPQQLLDAAEALDIDIDRLQELSRDDTVKQQLEGNQLLARSAGARSRSFVLLRREGCNTIPLQSPTGATLQLALQSLRACNPVMDAG